MPGTGYLYAYLHGFASSRQSRKGVFLRERLARDGIDLRLLDLNVPSFERQTYTELLGVVDALDRAEGETLPVRLIGSSLGGYVAARWAELHPRRVDRLVLLNPGFDLPARWPRLVGEKAMRRWEVEGTLPVADASGVERPLHWRFAEDAARHPAFPEVPCPTRILHGTRDDIVPPESSRGYAATRSRVELVELDDDHSLGDSDERILEEVRDFFGIGARERARVPEGT